mmetsp:Transcript_22528/g.44264  ORF Transcript_22528/g.44264 Transcript_22528/m.44264 type:complete len:421 (-) Transcript_22528:548-1810(-)|eukprot:CAMPEP_0171493794 /NCGR_PEP_ID=MMETSP0958-20121227/5158_1 /TAXON_ID=87120 /ORGANISM="Aurantiochytrium limacinum, Strain ATCCMYA-1381" /LENGTH=420 /DNA_ID=CAMNT_0012027453 /DNA_START=147 /DNA_END=1409 /DNA_ORIENTATION=+
MATPKTAHEAAVAGTCSSDQDDCDPRQCRICLDSSACGGDESYGSQWTRLKIWLSNHLRDDLAKPCLEGSAWISPCQCKGTQRWVHVACLRAWQGACVRNKSHRKASVCSVCQASYSLPPPRESLIVSAWNWIKTSRPILIIGPALFTVPVLLLLQIIFASLVFATVISFVRRMFSQETQPPPRPPPAVPRLPPDFNYYHGMPHRRTRRHNADRERAQPARVGAEILAPRADLAPEAVDVGPGVAYDDEARAIIFAPAASPANSVIQSGCLLQASDANPQFAGRMMLVEHFDQRLGASGVILNERLQGSAIVCARQMSRAVVESGVWLGRGGSLTNTTVTIIHQLDDIPGSNSYIGGFCVGHYATLRHFEENFTAAQLRDTRLKVIMGMTTWNPGQLEREVREGLWTISAPHATAPDVLF